MSHQHIPEHYMIEYRLTDADIRTLGSTVGTLLSTPRPPAETLDMAAVRVREWTTPLAEPIRALAARDANALLLKRCPIGESEPVRTPVHWSLAPSDLSRYPDLVVAGLGSMIGTVLGRAGEQGGRFVHHILPVAADADTQLETGSRQELWWHTEDAFDDARPSHIALLCLRNPDGVGTFLGDSDDLPWPALAQAPLRNPIFVLDPFTPGSPPKLIAPVFGDPRRPDLRLDRYLLRSPAEEPAASALSSLCQAVDDRLTRVCLEPGDCLIINNHGAVHGREAFAARFDGSDRWLLRVNIYS